MTELGPGRSGSTGVAVTGIVGTARAGAGRGSIPSPAIMRPRPMSASVSPAGNQANVRAGVSAVPAPRAGTDGGRPVTAASGLVTGVGAGADHGVDAGSDDAADAGIGSGRVSARAALYEALHGVDLNGADQRFLSRLCQWDKRNANAVASLLRQARQRGEVEGGLTPEQLEVVLRALTDAFAYRTSGAAAAACWDCASRPSGVCADHAQDLERARSFAAVLGALSGKVPPTPMTRLGAMTGLRRCRPVAS